MLSSLGKGYIDKHVIYFHSAGLFCAGAINPGECAPENLLSHKAKWSKTIHNHIAFSNHSLWPVGIKEDIE